jgi:hypothetical protein
MFRQKIQIFSILGYALSVLPHQFNQHSNCDASFERCVKTVFSLLQNDYHWTPAACLLPEKRMKAGIMFCQSSRFLCYFSLQLDILNTEWTEIIKESLYQNQTSFQTADGRLGWMFSGVRMANTSLLFSSLSAVKYSHWYYCYVYFLK